MKLKLFFYSILWISLNTNPVFGQGDEFFNQVIVSIKKQNFGLFQVGVITDGMTQKEIQNLTEIQTAPPRQMRIFATQTTKSSDTYRAFTYLVQDQKVQLIIIPPSRYFRSKTFIKKMGRMSRRKKIPIIAMDKAWIGSDAMLVYLNDTQPILHINEKVKNAMKHQMNDETFFEVIVE